MPSKPCKVKSLVVLELKMDSSFLKEQADRCRSLAEKADPFIKKRLLDLAARYDAKLGVPSRASRTLGIPGSLLEARLLHPPDTRT
jgi:hypothetical protein